MGLFRSALPCLLLSFFCLFPSPGRARAIFQEKQVLSPDKTVDLLVWRTDTAVMADTAGPVGDPGWECGAVDGPLRLSSCVVRPYARSPGAREQYLFWAFLNLVPASQAEDLSPQFPEQAAFFDGLRRPLLALKQKGDSCHYLIVFRDAYAPLAAGKVACPDLGSALRAVDEDLAGRASLVPREPGTAAKKVFKRGEISLDLPNSLDFGLEASAALAFGWTGDHTEGEGP
jgi:hypothetical protein